MWNGSIMTRLLQIPLALFTLVQIFLMWDAMLSLLSTNIPRNFVHSEWSRLMPSIINWGKTALEQFVKTVLDDLETFGDNLLILSHLTTFCNSWLILGVRHERLLPLVYSVLLSAKWINLRCSEHWFKSLLHIKNSIGPRIDPWGTPHVIKDGRDFAPLISTYWVRFDR